MLPHPQRNLPLWEKCGAHPTQPGASTATVGLGGGSWLGQDRLPWRQGGCQACAVPKLLWVDVGVQSTCACMLTVHTGSRRQGACSFQTRTDFLPSLAVLAVPRDLGMPVCHGHCRCSAVSDPGMAAGTHMDSSDCLSSSEHLIGAVCHPARCKKWQMMS